MIDSIMFSELGSSKLSALKDAILIEFKIEWAKVTYADLGKPLYSGIAAALFSEYVVMTHSTVSEIPRAIKDQANFWVSYFKPNGSAQVFETRANTFEESRAKCNVGADIVFILDESGSIGSADFEREKDFVVKAVENLVLGPSANQVGVITYGSSSGLDIQLNQYHNKEQLISAVKAIRYSGGGTATDLALKQMQDVAFSTSHGARPTDQGHPRVGIVLTDGGSNNYIRTQEEAKRAKDQDITLFSVGVGTYVNVPELEGIASDPTCLYYFQLNGGFDEILDLVSSISATTCSVPIYFEKNGTLVKPVDPGFPYNCEITVSPKGTSLVVSTTRGNMTLFLSSITYPSEAFFDAKIAVKYDSPTQVFIPPTDSKEDRIIYCSILSEGQTNLTIITVPGPITFNCKAGRNPCTKENIAQGKFYFPHDNPNQYVQCGSVGQCFDMFCPAGLVWDKDILTCNWPPVAPTPPPPATQPPTGYTCAAPSPCTPENIAGNGYYFPHVDPKKFIQCDAHGGCFEMACAPGTVWDDRIKTCNFA